MIRDKDYLIFTAAYQTPKPHRHLGLHLLFALEGMLACRVEGQEITCSGICIDSNVCHTAHSLEKPGRELVVLVEKTSLLAQQIREQLLWTGHGYQSFSVLPQELINGVRKCFHNRDEAGMVQEIRTLSGRCERKPEITDQRIRKVLEQIRLEQTIDRDIYKKLSQTACLSQSRLSHLFKEQAGVSLAGYLTWAKLEKAYRLIQAGEKMTDAAVNAGFSSSSHLSSTFRRMFGITCSEFLNSF